MRNIYIILIIAVAISACGGGAGNSAPSQVPKGTVAGIGFDGLILNGTVRIYDYSGGTKGALLGSAVTDSKGLYSVSINAESRPVQIEVTGGFYIEEAGANVKIALTTDHKLTALANFTTGSALNTSVTTYTHLAAGLAKAQIRNGKSVAAAINDANTRISSWVGLNIASVTPKDITDIANASFNFTPELKYGFLAGAISTWTYTNSPANAKHAPPYTSINFAQLMYDDISYDGLLDGIAFDTSNAPYQIAFGTIPLNADVYRLGLAASLVQMASSPNNKTGLDGAAVMLYAKNHANGTDASFNGVQPKPLVASTVAIASPLLNSYVRRTINIGTTTTTSFGIKTYELLVNGIVILSSPTAASLQLNTKEYIDGSYNVSVRITDMGGFITTANTTIIIDNTAPKLSGTNITESPTTLYGTTSDLGGSGVVSVEETLSRTFAQFLLGGWVMQPPQPWSWNSIFRVKDAIGNCNDYMLHNGNVVRTGTYTGTWTATLTLENACP